MANAKLHIGDYSDNGQITIVDEDRLCYVVKSVNRGSIGLRTISKALLREFIDYLFFHHDAQPRDARDALSGKSEIDKFEYGYESTLLMMAKMILGIENVNHSISSGTKPWKTNSSYLPYLTALRTKPFMLLAGISGTGKSRIVREMAKACWASDEEDYGNNCPRNFCMVQVKPNWHDSSELIGYVSRINGEKYIIGPFLRFIAQALKEPQRPYFLCLDEMNLAPVEQYFAEYLSVIESRKRDEQTGQIVTDPILPRSTEDWYLSLVDELLTDCPDNTIYALRAHFLDHGIAIPHNLIVVGTVNMDETTFSFSRKVLDRAMTIEMNEVNLNGGLDSRHERIGKLTDTELVGTAVEGVDIYTDYKDVCDIVINYLGKVNQELDSTPFKIAYRTRNEFLLYVINNLPYHTDDKGNELPQDAIIARALDEITSMKILSRIEGDETKVSEAFLNRLSETIKTALQAVYADAESSVSLPKLAQMKQRLASGYTSFWC